MRQLSLFTSVLLVLVFSACESDDLLREATGIMDDKTDVPASCGWLINVNGAYYQPTYLPSQYEIEGLEVYFTFEPLEQDLGCRFINTTVQPIRLIQIKPR